MKTPQLVFSLDADLLFPPKYIAKVLVAEEAARQKKKAEDRQWASRWYQQRQQQQYQQQQSETPWYKTFFRGENAQSTTYVIGDDEATSSSSSSWTGKQEDSMGTTALDYDTLWQEAKIAFSDDRENFDPNYTPLPTSSPYNYTYSNATSGDYDPSAPPLSIDQIDVYGGMSQSLKDSCVPLISRKKPLSYGRGGWIKRKRRLRPKKNTTFSCPLVRLPSDAEDDMPDLEAGIPLPGSSSSAINKTHNGLRRRRKKTRGCTYNK